MVIIVRILPALFEQLQITLDETTPALQQKSDLTRVQLARRELGHAREGRQIVGHRRRRVTHDLTDLSHRLARERQAHDLHAMRQHWTNVMHRAAQRYWRWRLLLAQRRQIARDGARAPREDAIRQIFARQQYALAQCFLTEIRNTRLPKRGGTFVL